MQPLNVLGSVNLDVVASVSHLPSPGETVGDATLAFHPGGKGANQALAAARMGADVVFTAAVGNDAEAGLATPLLEAESRIELDLSVVDLPTGIALIVVDRDGENQIVVAPGANGALGPDRVRGLTGSLLCQLEVPIETIAAALDAASGPRILNAAPFVAEAVHLLSDVDVLVVNEVERSAFAGALDTFGGLVVTTLGPRGATVEQQGRTIATSVPPAANPIDTVGAGDAFCGTFAAHFGTGSSLERVLELAVTAGALATESAGAQPSLPTLEEVETRCPSRS